MAKILFVWELGLGFGHLNRHRDLMRRLVKEKHKVYFAAREVGNAERVFGGDNITLLQAPFMTRGVNNPIRKPRTHAHLIYNVGLSEVTPLTGRIKAWMEIHNYVKPDLVIYDHSPTAQLAFRNTRSKHILCGTGFTVPPVKVPMPNMRYWEKVDESIVLKNEERILTIINQTLKGLKRPQLKNIAEMMQSDANMLLTFKELDHYQDREDAEYLGITAPQDYGMSPEWPEGGKKKVFAYLYPFKTLPALLTTLNNSNVSVLIYAPEVSQVAKNKHSSEKIKFTDQPLRISEATEQCDLAITNGTHATTGAVLLAGKPLLLLPQNMERILVSKRVKEMGAGLAAPQLKPEGMAAKLKNILTEDEFREKAQAFSKRYADFDRDKQLDRMTEIVTKTLS